MVNAGDIIQITDEAHAWFPCLLTVTEVKGQGVRAFVAIPQANDRNDIGRACIKLQNDLFEVVGKAVFIPARGAGGETGVIRGSP